MLAKVEAHLIEYIATFPNLTINSGEEYRACIATGFRLICKTGNNSPAEFVYLSLNATREGVQQAVVADEEGAVTVEEDTSADECTGGCFR
jgi:hypothetical protein